VHGHGYALIADGDVFSNILLATGPCRRVKCGGCCCEAGVTAMASVKPSLPLAAISERRIQWCGGIFDLPAGLRGKRMQQIRMRTFTYFFDLSTKLAASKKSWTGTQGASDVHH
jgi:hypothetical protein